MNRNIAFTLRKLRKITVLRNSLMPLFLSVGFFIGCTNPIVTDILPGTVKPLTGSVLITGNNWVGETLTADTSFLDGSGVISYRWMRGGNGIGNNNGVYVIDTEDVGKDITVTVSRAYNKGTVTSNAVRAVYQNLSTGTIPMLGGNKIGETLTVDTSTLSGGSGTFGFQWQADGVDIPGKIEISYTIQGKDAGKVIQCVITRSDAVGILMSQSAKVPYSITIESKDTVAGDLLTASNDAGNAGDIITLNYTLINAGFYNELNFGGINSAVIPAVRDTGSGTRSYTIDTSDASNGVIIILATFEHTNLSHDPIAFTNAAPHITVTYGDNGNSFINAITAAHSGAGTISYSSEHTDIADVDYSGAVSIYKAGTTVITADKAADTVYAHASKSYILEVTPRSLTITPDSGQGKVYGENDPAFTYTAGETLINGNSFSGSLSRIPGETAGTYRFTPGTLSAGGNYAPVLGGNESFTISKASGAAVSGAVTAAGISASGGIMVNGVFIPVNPGGQVVEYAVSVSSSLSGAAADALVWQTGLSFNGLTAGTDYYVYARSAENANYNAGEYSVSAAICFYLLSFDANGAGGAAPAAHAVLPGTAVTLPTAGGLAKTGSAFGCWNTMRDGAGNNYAPGQSYTVTANGVLYAKWVAEQTFPFPFTPPVDNQPIASGITVSQSGLGAYPITATLNLTNQSEYDSVEWRYGSVVLGNGPELVLNGADIRYNIVGTHNITVMARKNGVLYSSTISFNVVL